MPPERFAGAGSPPTTAQDSAVPAAAGSATPLLSIAIPSFNRAEQLRTLLAVLLPQVAEFPQQVEVYVSDNASTDSTPGIIAAAHADFAAAGGCLRSHRHGQNIGSDANFASCFREVRGHFFWMCGDDDLIVPGALAQVMPHLRNASGEVAEIDLLYATSYGFREDYAAERQNDPLGRCFHTVRDPRRFAKLVNIMFTFISGMIVNRARFLQLAHEEPDAFVGSNLVQLSWSLPLLREFRKGVVLWQRPVAARVGNAHGYSLGAVFGTGLANNVRRLLPGRPDLQSPIVNFALRRWFPSVLVDLRSAGNSTLMLHQAHTELRQVYGRNPLFWLFTWPALMLPLRMARAYTGASAFLGKLFYAANLPGFWRRQT